METNEEKAPGELRDSRVIHINRVAAREGEGFLSQHSSLLAMAKAELVLDTGKRKKCL